MGKIRKIKPITSTANMYREEEDMEISYTKDNNFIVLSTSGSDNRTTKRKTSQALYFDSTKAKELVEFLNNWINGQIATSG